MGWTDERVEVLRKLWLEGLSASQIAKQLGGGVTRNAVIGKVHRLGMSGRSSPSQPVRTPTQVAPRLRPANPPEKAAGRPAETPPAAPPPARFVAEAAGSATVLTLGAHMCKWPIGDPSSSEFSFCGRRASEGPYCVEHAQVAYQPQQKKGRSAASELARSLRRYI